MHFLLQAEIVKSSLQGEWENLNTSAESWVTRWTQTKGRLEDTQGVDRKEMVDRCRTIFEAILNWDKFVADRDELLYVYFHCTLNNLIY